MIITMIISVWAQEDDGSKAELIGGVWYQGGQVLNGTYNYANDIDHYWLQKVFANLGLKRINKWLAVTAALEAQMRLSYKQGSTYLESQFYSYNFYIDQARGDITASRTDLSNSDLPWGISISTITKALAILEISFSKAVAIQQQSFSRNLIRIVFIRILIKKGMMSLYVYWALNSMHLSWTTCFLMI